MSADPLHLFHGIRAPGLTWAGKVVNGYDMGELRVGHQAGLGSRA